MNKNSSEKSKNNFPIVRFPFADAPGIIRAHQQDDYFNHDLKSRVVELLRKLWGPYFVNYTSAEISLFTSLLYLGTSTLVGSQTLGEEYCDLIHINSSGVSLPGIKRRLGFIISTTIVPYYFTKYSQTIKRKALNILDDLKSYNYSNDKLKLFGLNGLSNYLINSIDDILNPENVYAVNLAIFYIFGTYYHISKRIWGIRYIFGHNSESIKKRVGYEALGTIILIQLAIRIIKKTQTYFADNSPNSLKKENQLNLIIDKNKNNSNINISLSDPSKLKYIPENSRKCTLCLSYMNNPSVTTCGHLFCWDCITEWTRERPECPLCRQLVAEQNVLPLQ